MVGAQFWQIHDLGVVYDLHLVELLVSQSYSKGAGNGVVIEDIVEDNVVSISGKDSRLLMLEWLGMAFDVCPVVEPSNDENVGNLDCYKENCSNMEYLVKISKKAHILELKRRHLKIIVQTSNTPYPSRKIRRICACTSQKTTKETRSIHRLRKKYCLSLKNDMPPRDRIHGVSLDDGLVLLMADVDVIKLLNHVPSYSKGAGNGVVIEDIVEDNVVSISGKDSRLLMLEWLGMGK
ncbi:hypothetical protein Tco_0755859 [Tanacetum coccineum]